MVSWPLWLNALAFLPAAAAIWWAGTRLERYADAIAERTGLGRAFTGVLLLAAATSLPEVATTITAVAVLGNAELAVHNLLGGVAMQTALIAVADCAKRKRGALTFFSPRFALLIQGVGVLLLLQITIAGISADGRPSVGGVSLWLVLLAFGYAVMMYLTYRYRGQPRWTPSRADDVPAAAPGDDRVPQQRVPAASDREDGRRTRVLWLRFAGGSLIVLAGGWIATQTADALATQSGLGSAFMGATLLALATSLPELSTTVSAARNGRFTVVVSNVFGSNAFDVVLLLVADLLFRGGTVLAHAKGSVVLVAAVGAIMTCVYLWGLLERENRTVLGIGWDSAAAIAVYLMGMTALYVITS